MKTYKKAHFLLSIAFAFSIRFSIFGAGAQQNMPDYAGQVFPPDHALNMAIDQLPVHPNSDNFITSIGKTTALHPDFGTSYDSAPMGIPYNVVGAGQAKLPLTFTDYGDESDTGPWPIPANPFIEGVYNWKDSTDGDRHMLIVDSSSHLLYEAGNVYGNASRVSWKASGGSIFDLNSYKLRPADWTSADAAGLPIFPLLIRYDEVTRAMASSGEIHHAIRFTVGKSQKAYIWPARHQASSSTDQNRPPMGLRVRMKASVDISGYSPRMQVILRTFKKYGMIVADNGSNWFFQGTHDDRWDDEELNTLKQIHGSDFEVVDNSSWTSRRGFDENSAKVPPGSDVISSSPRAKISNGRINVSNCKSGNLSFVKIAYTLDKAGYASIALFDFAGRRLLTLLNRQEVAGSHVLEWDGKDETGHVVGNSVCVIRLTVSKGVFCQKIWLN